MNKIQLLVGAAGLLASASLFAQGQFNFNNLSGARPKIFGVDGTTPIAGVGFLVDVLVKNPATGNYEGIQRNGVDFTGIAPLSGANAGLFSGNVVTVPFVAPGATADVRVRAWDVSSGATFSSALISGSVDFTVGPLGGGSPPAPPASMANFASFQLAVIPEPSTYALAALGLGGLLLFRRK
jgi:PEP-CTERM motif